MPAWQAALLGVLAPVAGGALVFACQWVITRLDRPGWHRSRWKR